MNNLIKKQITKLVKEAHFSLRKDVLGLLKKAYNNESNKKAKNAISWILENAQIAKIDSVAICQDTGLPVVFIEVGKNESVSYSFVKQIRDLIAEEYKNNYLRASIVDPLNRKTPSYSGVVSHIDFCNEVRGVRVTLLPKGFGSENKSQLKMFNPTVDIEDIENFVVETVKKSGAEACPPFVVGVGIGGTSDYALLLAKKALVERIDLPSKDKLSAKIEKNILKKIQLLNIGPMGFGGKHTALAVKIKTAPTHIAGLPVGVNVSCHALRSATYKFRP